MKNTTHILEDILSNIELIKEGADIVKGAMKDDPGLFERPLIKELLCNTLGPGAYGVLKTIYTRCCRDHPQDICVDVDYVDVTYKVDDDKTAKLLTRGV